MLRLVPKLPLRLSRRLSARTARTVIGVAVVVLASTNVMGAVTGATPADDEGAGPLQPATSAPVAAATAVEEFDAYDAPAPPNLPQGEDALALALPNLPQAAALPAPPSVPADVVVQRPTLRLPQVDDAESLAAALAAVEGVTGTATVEVGEVAVQTAGATETLTLAAVDPLAFRPLTPEVSATYPQLWERLLAGDAAFTHDVGHRFAAMAVPLGSTVPVGDDGTLRIGAYASNGIPPVADAVVSQETARSLGLEGRTEVLIAVADGSDPAALAQQIAQVAGVAPEVIEQPVQQRAFLTGGEAQAFFEPYTYIDHGDGMITIDPAWVAANIVRARVPIFTGEVVCHRQYVEQLIPALQEVVDQGLAHLIDPTQYGGCWVPRHIDWRPDRPLSMHSWGLALDLNVSTNQLGAVPTLDLRIVEIFESYGFAWGGRWSRPDGMHFELGAVLTGGQG